MRWPRWAGLWLVVATVVACGGEEFADQGSGGATAGGAGGTGGSVSGGSGGETPAGGGGIAATGGVSGTGASAGAGGSTGGTGGPDASTGGSAGVDASVGGTGAIDASVGGTGGADASTSCPPPSAVTQIAQATGNPEYPRLAGTMVYFATDPAIYRIPVAGGTLEPLNTGASNNEGLAILTHNLFWADRGSSQLKHYDLTASTYTGPVVSSQTGIQGVAADATHVYWAFNGGIRRRQSVTQDLYASQGAYAIALGETEVFWVTQAGAVLKGPKGGTAEGGSAQQLALQPNPVATNWAAVTMALDGTHVYWTARYTADGAMPDGGLPPDGVWRVPRNGGGAVQQILPAPAAEGIALSASCIYVGSRGPGGNGRVYVRDKSLSGPAQYLGGFTWPRGLSLEGTTLVIADSAAGLVYRSTL